MTKYYVDSDGKYIGGYQGNHGINLSEYTEVPDPPSKTNLIWDAVAKDYVLDNLTVHKQERFKEIDAKTSKLIALGFSHDNGNGAKQFSMSNNAQLNLLGADIKRSDGVLPLTFCTIDDMDQEIFTTDTQLDAFFMSALTTKMTHLDSGSVLKSSVRDAANEAAIDAVIDNR